MRLAAKDTSATATDTGGSVSRAVYLTRPEDIGPVLKLLRDHSTDIELRLSGTDGHYRGRVLDLNHDHFLLEDIRPRDGLAHLRRGTRFSFAARVEDLYIRAEDCRITKVESERGLPFFRANLPQRLLRHQRRQHARITLPPRVRPDEGIVWVARKHGGADLKFHIVDISVGGARLSFNGAVLPSLQSEEVLPSCQFKVSGSLAFETPAVIRHAAWDPVERTTVCGIEFSDMAVGDRRRLEHYVSQLTARTPKS